METLYFYRPLLTDLHIKVCNCNAPGYIIFVVSLPMTLTTNFWTIVIVTVTAATVAAAAATTAATDIVII